MPGRPATRRRSASGSGATRLMWIGVLVWFGWCVFRLELTGTDGAGPALAPAVGAPLADLLARWAARLGGLGWFLAVGAAALISGNVSARLLHLRPRGDLLLLLALGWGISGVAQFGLALAGLSFPLVAGSLGLLPLALGRPPRPRLGLPAWRGATLHATLAGGVLALCLCAALAPEVENDPLQVHDANPRRMLALHKLTAWPFGVADDYPWLWEMIRLPVMAPGGEDASRWLPPLLLAGIAIGAGQLAMKLAGAGWAWGTIALVATNPFLVRQALGTKNDLLAAWFAMAAFTGALDARSGRPRARSAGAGAVVGLAFLTKYPAGAALLGALAALPGSWRQRWARLPLAGGALAIVALPLLARNWLVSGDPAFPFMGSMTGSPFQAPAARDLFRTHLHVLTAQEPGLIGPGRAVRAALGMLAPEESLLRWAMFLPLLALGPGRLPAPLPAAGIALAGFLVPWFAGPPMMRYLVPAFPFGCLLAVGALARSPGHWPRGALAAAVIVQSLHAALQPAVTERLPAGAGLESPAEWTARRLTTLDAAAVAARGAMPRNGRLLIHGDSRIGLFPARTVAASFGEAMFPPFAAVHASRTPTDVAKRLRQQNWDWMLYNWMTAFFWRASATADPWTERDLALWSGWWRTHAELVWTTPRPDREQGDFMLFRIHRGGTTRRATVVPGLEGWMHRIERAVSRHEEAAARRDLAALRRAAPDWGATDALEAVIFASQLPPSERRRLHDRARARGWPGAPAR